MINGVTCWLLIAIPWKVCHRPSQKEKGLGGWMTVLMMPFPLSALNSARPSTSCSSRKSLLPWMDMITALLTRGFTSIVRWNWWPTENREPKGKIWLDDSFFLGFLGFFSFFFFGGGAFLGMFNLITSFSVFYLWELVNSLGGEIGIQIQCVFFFDRFFYFFFLVFFSFFRNVQFNHLFFSILSLKINSLGGEIGIQIRCVFFFNKERHCVSVALCDTVVSQL